MEFDDSVVRFNIHDAMKHPSEDHSVFHVDLLDELIDEHLSDFFHDTDFPSLTDSYTCLACTDSEMCSFCIDQFLDIDVDTDSDILHASLDCEKSECTNLIAGTCI